MSAPPHPLSAFLPAGFDPTRPVAVIAGKAVYPALTVAAMRKANLPVRLIAFEGETDAKLVETFPKDERASIKVGQLGKMLKAIKGFGAAHAIMVGQVTPKRLFKGLHPDLKALSVLGKLKERNAETIFGAISGEIEALGVRMLDARSFLDDHLASPGLMAGRKLRVERDHIDHGVRIAKEIARLDIGQGCVVRKGTVLAVEAFEGTDKMLARANEYKTDQLIFVKTVKPRQDYRFDVPCFGLRTLEVMREHGIGLACLEARSTIMLEKPEVLRRAEQWGIDLYGYEA